MADEEKKVDEKIQDAADKAVEKAKELNNTPDHTAEFDSADIENNKVMAILAYLGILVLVPIFAAKESPFARFHSNQGLILCIVGIVLGFIPIIKWFAWIFELVFAVLGIMNAAKGLAKELPFIGKFKLLK